MEEEALRLNNGVHAPQPSRDAQPLARALVPWQPAPADEAKPPSHTPLPRPTYLAAAAEGGQRGEGRPVADLLVEMQVRSRTLHRTSASVT